MDKSTIKVKSIKRISLPEPVPVYDVTVPIYENFMLANGVIVHNSSKIARYKDFQATFALKGKPLNVMEVTSAKVNANVEICSIFAGIGLDLGAKNPIDSIKFGKIIFLADGDVDGPVVGSTRVLTLDGKNPTIKTLAKRWQRDKKPIWVLSRNEYGELVPAKAINPRVAVRSTQLVKIHLDDGTILRCEPSHKWMMSCSDANDSRRTEYLGNQFIRAKRIKIGDSLDSIYLEDRTTDGLKGRINSTYRSVINDPATSAQFEKSAVPVHRIVFANENPDQYAFYVKHNKGSLPGDRYAIHHGNRDTRDNEPCNLEMLHQGEHAAEHFSEYAASYNGSKKHKQDLKKFAASARGKQIFIENASRLAAYNTSAAHRARVVEMNLCPDQIRKQMLGKVARLWKGIVLSGFPVNTETWAIGLRNPKLSNIYTLGTALSVYSKKEILTAVKKLAVHKAYVFDIDCPKRSYPTQVTSKFVAFCKEMVDQGLNYTKESVYNEYRSEVVAVTNQRGIPLWKTGFYSTNVPKSQLKSFVTSYKPNHQVVKIEHLTLETPMEFYCMTVPETGNFFFSDKYGNGVGSSNCHINTLLMTVFWKYLPECFERGMIYMVDAPEYMTHYKGKLYFGKTRDDVYKQVGTKIKVELKQLKGWGSTDPEDLQPMAFDVTTRKLIRILPPTSKAGAKQFEALMGKSPLYRQKLLGVVKN